MHLRPHASIAISPWLQAGSLAAGLLLSSCSGDSGSGHSEPGFARNLVIFTVDTLRADFTGPYSTATDSTPQFDRLAQQSLLFERAYSPATLTNPSLTSMLTGLLPIQHQVHEQNSGFASGIIPLPFLCQASGFATGSFLANMCKLQGIRGTVYHDGWDERYCGMLDDPENYSDQYLWDEAVVTNGLEWMAEQQRPFLAWLHLMDPHAEHRPPPRYWDYAGDRPREKFEQYAYYNEYEALRTLPPEEVRERLLDLYRAEITGADDQLGRLLDFLDETGLAETTALIATADHGEELFETWNRYDHGFSMTEGVFWIPMMIRAPGLAPGRVGAPVELAQVTPTALELLELDAPYELSGKSLLAENPSRGYALSYGGPWVTSARTSGKRYWKRHVKEAPTREEAGWRLEAPWFTEPQLLCEYEAGSPTTPAFLDIQGDRVREANRMAREVDSFHQSLPRFGKGFQITDPDVLEFLRANGYIIDEPAESE